jgi:hypothetical protein
MKTGRASQVSAGIVGRLEALNDRLERSMYPGGRPNRMARVLNRGWALVGRAGLWPSRLVTLEVRSRRRATTISFPLMVADLGGERYLVAMLGERARWVSNVRAANGHVDLWHGPRERVRLEEVEPSERPPILRRYVKVAPGGRAMIQVQPDAPQADFERIAPRYPVFRIVGDSGAHAVRTTPRLWIFNRLVNPLLRPLLRSRLRGRLGRAVALLTFRGAISGRETTIPVQFARDASNRYVVIPGDPEHKRWWRNLRTPSPVRLLVAGEEVVGTGHVAAEPERAALLRAYVQRFPASARKLGLHKGADGNVAADVLAKVARQTVVVVVKPE